MGRKKSAASDMEVREKQINPLAQRLSELITDANALKDHLGVSMQAVNQYKLGLARPSLENLCKIADFYGVSTDYLLGRVEYSTVDKDKTVAIEVTGLSEKAIDVLIPHAHDWQTHTLSRLLEEYPHFLSVLSNIVEYNFKYLDWEKVKANYKRESQEIAAKGADYAWKTPRKITGDMLKEKELLVKAFRFSIYESLMETVDRLVEKTYKEDGNNGKHQKKD